LHLLIFGDSKFSASFTDDRTIGLYYSNCVPFFWEYIPKFKKGQDFSIPGMALNLINVQFQ